MNILFIAAEASPLVKIGGLGDVIGSLPKALKGLGHDVRIMLPNYSGIDTSRNKIMPLDKNLKIEMAQAEEPASLYMTETNDGTIFYLIDNGDFFGSPDVYGKNELRKFLFFNKAVIAALAKLKWKPHIIHCHDWHTALIPMWLRKSNWNGRSLFTIHNLAYQGNLDNEFMYHYGLGQDWQCLPKGLSEVPLNLLSQGIIWSDMLNTVSENYAREILKPELGAGLDHLLRYRQNDFVGIINGIDYDIYNPATDHFIRANYDAGSFDRKSINKKDLQKKVGLEEDGTMPLIGMVSRLDEQKGLDIVIESLPTLFNITPVQMVILGRGKEQYENSLQKAAKTFPGRLAVSNDFDETLARHIYAGCDMFLMPSRFEPCGLGQLIAMRYGTIPIVRHTGGLVDTVKDLSPDLNRGSGFIFNTFNVESILSAIQRAVAVFENKIIWQQIINRIMTIDFSWQNSARKYEALYRNMLEPKRE